MSFRIITTSLVPPNAASDPFTLSAAEVGGSLSGPDNAPETGIAPTMINPTMFIRLLMRGPAPADPTKQPTLLVAVGSGAEVEVATTAPSLANLMDGGNPTEAAAATRYDADSNNASLVKFFIFIPGSAYQVKVKNRDVLPRAFTVVVAGTLSDSRQAWLNAFSPEPQRSLILNYKLLPNQSLPQNLLLGNVGTGPVTVTGFTPPLGPEFSILPAALPITVPPNPPAPVALAITYTAPAAPTTPDGITTVTAALTSNDTGAGAVAGHNNSVTFVADLQVPAFAPSPHAFGFNGADAHGALSYKTVTLNGKNFNVGTPVVKFGTAQANLVGTPTATQIQVEVPQIPSGPYLVSVTTAAGTAVSSSDFFSIVMLTPEFNPPVLGSQFLPQAGPPGTQVTLMGVNFTLAGHVTDPTVMFGTIPATIIGPVSDLRIVVVVPAMNVGPVKITVTAGQVSGVSDQVFTVTPRFRTL